MTSTTLRLGVWCFGTWIVAGTCSGGCTKPRDEDTAAAKMPSATKSAVRDREKAPEPAPAKDIGDSGADAGAKEKPAQAPQPTAIVLSEGFSTPESVLHDAEQDVYFVSNVAGSPLDMDDNGFISRIDAESGAITAKWIDGAHPKVELNAPKGMAIFGDILYVADIDTVRRFDRKTGAPKGKIAIKGAAFINDLAIDSKGTIYASDTGIRKEGEASATDKKDAIYAISPTGKVSLTINHEHADSPNGLALEGDSIWTVSWDEGRLLRIANGHSMESHALPGGRADGLVRLDDGSFLISSWDAKAIFRGRSFGDFQTILRDLESPADIGWDDKRKLILVPLFNADRVELYPLPAAQRQ